MTSKGATIDVGAWLRNLGLGQYEAAFRENNVDDTVLPNLTAEDIKDLGIGTVGHRRKLLDGIALLRAETTAKGPPSEVLSTPPKPLQDTAERRQVIRDVLGPRRLDSTLGPHGP